ncbi:hypothetical protein EVG20_g11235 [Dentipellis fragilis]|uniref:Uncharacterized protein n=1 Tax=Dentipellis fragilis TaxID=205917 RepID=A0A4Y9XLM4_9AGAM|nr:hypothetical protein EVG20_g11235 [Dentipellis fragilis]
MRPSRAARPGEWAAYAFEAPAAAEARFSLTYRLVYADGHVHWLGSPGHDVVCVLKKADPWLVVRRGWERAAPTEGDEPSTEVWQHRELNEGDIQFAQIRQTGNWGCWAIGHQSVHYHIPGSDVPNARYLLFIPRVHPRTFALHRPLILYAESGSLHLSSSGMLTCPPSSRIHVFRGLSIDRNCLHDDLEALDLRWIGEQDGFALIASPEDQLPARIAFIPHLASPSDILEPRLRTRWAGLEQSLFAYRRYMLFCPASRQMLDYVAGVDYDLALRVGAAGGACVLSPIHALPVTAVAADDRDVDVAWEISILTPHAGVDVPQQKQTQPDVGSAPAPAQEPQQEKQPETTTVKEELDSRIGTTTPAPAPEALPAALLQTLVVLVQAAFLRMFFLLTPRFANLSVRSPRSTSASPSRTASGNDSDEAAEPYSRGESPAADYTDTETLAGTEVPSDSVLASLPARPVGVLAFDILEGPLELVYCRAGAAGQGEGKGAGEDRELELEVLLDDEPLDLSSQEGWTLTVVDGAVRGGRLEALLRDKREVLEV